MNHTGASACYICPEGYYCVNRDHADICPQGYYCPTGTGADWQLCPVGTFGNTTGLSEEAHCTFCTGVFLCVCVREREGEEKRKNPQVRENKSQTSLRILNCVLCVCLHISGGHYCNTPGISAPSAECAAGYYCEYGVDTATPTDTSQHTGVGGECPAGFYCPRGTIQPISCPSGTFTTTTSEYSSLAVRFKASASNWST